MIFFKPKLPYRPKSRVDLVDPSGEHAAALGASIFAAAIAYMITESLGWPSWIPWIIPVGTLWWRIEVRVRLFNELAHQWNRKIDEEETTDNPESI